MRNKFFRWKLSQDIKEVNEAWFLLLLLINEGHSHLWKTNKEVKTIWHSLKTLYEIQLKGSKEERKEITKVTRQSEEKVTDGDSDIDCDKTDRKHDE